MAQDGNSQEQEQLGKVEAKLDKLRGEKDGWRPVQAEREEKVRRMHSLEQAAGIVKIATDWMDTGNGAASVELAGKSTLEMADQFYRWVEGGTL